MKKNLKNKIAELEKSLDPDLISADKAFSVIHPSTIKIRQQILQLQQLDPAAKYIPTIDKIAGSKKDQPGQPAFSFERQQEIEKILVATRQYGKLSPEAIKIAEEDETDKLVQKKIMDFFIYEEGDTGTTIEHVSGDGSFENIKKYKVAKIIDIQFDAISDSDKLKTEAVLKAHGKDKHSKEDMVIEYARNKSLEPYVDKFFNELPPVKQNVIKKKLKQKYNEDFNNNDLLYAIIDAKNIARLRNKIDSSRPETVTEEQVVTYWKHEQDLNPPSKSAGGVKAKEINNKDEAKKDLEIEEKKYNALLDKNKKLISDLVNVDKDKKFLLDRIEHEKKTKGPGHKQSIANDEDSLNTTILDKKKNIKQDISNLHKEIIPQLKFLQDVAQNYTVKLFSDIVRKAKDKGENITDQPEAIMYLSTNDFETLDGTPLTDYEPAKLDAIFKLATE